MATIITSSVGRNGVNNSADVAKIQQLLDDNLHLLIPFDPLGALTHTLQSDIDKLAARIETFQRRVMPQSSADGRVDPGGKTLAVLDANSVRAKAKGIAGNKGKLPLYPFLRHSAHDPEIGARFFGADRNGGRRKHAGIDLKFPAGTPIRAMADGEVIVPPKLFYDGVFAFAVDHGSFIARYGEISRTAPGFDRVGAKVRRGETIAFVGQLSSGNSMLHLELYSGVGVGPLSTSLLPFKRRDDLLNPMDFIKASTLNDAPGQEDRNARVSNRVSNLLTVRGAPNLGAPVVAKLSPGTFLDVVDEVTGAAYPTNTGTSTTWFQVDIEGTSGFAAAFFIDRVSTSTPRVPAPSLAPVPSFDAVGAFVRVSQRVNSILFLRTSASPAATPNPELEPSTPLEIIQKLVGAAYPADGGSRNDWLEVTVKDGPQKGKTGFVAAFFVDPVLRTGKANSNVSTGLVAHDQPATDGARVAVLMPGTRFTVVRATTGGEYELTPGGAKRSDWYDIEHDSKRGFVAAAFVDLLDPADVPHVQTSDGNGILLTYEPTGASDKTARQDGLPARGIHGVQASEEMAKTDLPRIKPLKNKFVDAGKLFDLPPALLAAIASRESRCGNVLDKNGFGDRGNAFGIMQVDKRFHSPIETEDGSNGEAHIQQATQILGDKLDGVNRNHEGLSDSQALQAAVSHYNGGRGLLPPNSDKGTTGGDYMNDVWARARYIAENW